MTAMGIQTSNAQLVQLVSVCAFHTAGCGFEPHHYERFSSAALLRGWPGWYLLVCPREFRDSAVVLLVCNFWALVLLHHMFLSCLGSLGLVCSFHHVLMSFARTELKHTHTHTHNNTRPQKTQHYHTQQRWMCVFGSHKPKRCLFAFCFHTDVCTFWCSLINLRLCSVNTLLFCKQITVSLTHLCFMHMFLFREQITVS